MYIDRKALWAVRQCALPTVVRACLNCSGTRHHPSGKFRVNANGKLLDVWLLLLCAVCGRTSKVPVHERVHVQSLEPALLVAYQTNDPAVLRELVMSASLAAKNGYRLDWAGTWELETGTACHVLDGPTSLRVLISFELPAPVRVERLLMLGLGLSRAEVRRMVVDGRVHLPLAPDAKAHQDFEFTIDGLGAREMLEASHRAGRSAHQPEPGRGTGTASAEVGRPGSSPADRRASGAAAVSGPG